MTGSVPIKVVSRVYGKNSTWVRAGLISGYLPIGYATRNGRLVTDVNEINSKLGRINYYISPKKLFEHSGYEWKGEKE